MHLSSTRADPEQGGREKRVTLTHFQTCKAVDRSNFHTEEIILNRLTGYKPTKAFVFKNNPLPGKFIPSFPSRSASILKYLVEH